MKKLLVKFLTIPAIAKIIIKLLLLLHQRLYSYISSFAMAVESGNHPKHRIMKYKEWFADNIMPDWVILDIGCNTGLMPYLLAEKAKFVYGIEIDENHVLEAKRKRQKQNIEYVCADATAFDFSGKSVDCVTLSNVLEHIEDRVSFLRKILGNVSWKDKENRRLLIRVPMIDRDWVTLYKKELGMEYRLDPTHFVEYTEEQFAGELREAGLGILHQEIRWGEIWCVASPMNEVNE